MLFFLAYFLFFISTLFQQCLPWQCVTNFLGEITFSGIKKKSFGISDTILDILEGFENILWAPDNEAKVTYKSLPYHSLGKICLSALHKHRVYICMQIKNDISQYLKRKIG